MTRLITDVTPRLHAYTPLELTGMFLQVLKNKFADANNITTEQLKEVLWNTDYTLTNITIRPIFEWEPKNPNQRPAIVVKRNTTSSQPISIDDKLGAPRPGDGRQKFNAMLLGSHSVFCLSPKPAQTELLGYEVFSYLLHWAPMLRRLFHLNRFNIGNISTPFRVKENREIFGVVINTAYAFLDTWAITEQAPLLKDVGMSIS